MSETQDRLLDLALEEELSGARPPDLLPALRQRIAAERGRASRRFAPRRLVPGLLAAGLVLAVGLTPLLRRGPAPALATSDDPILTVGADGVEGPRTGFRAGDRLVAPGPRTAVLVFADRTRVLLGPRSVLVLEAVEGGPAPRLLVGRASVVRSADRPLALPLPGGEARLSGPGLVVLTAPPASVADLEAGALLDLARGRQPPAPPRPVLVTAVVGRVALEAPGVELALRAGEEALVRALALPERWSRPSPETGARLDGLLADLALGEVDAAGGDPAARDRRKRAARAVGALAEALGEDPGGWAYVRARVALRPADPAREDARRRGLSLLARDPSLGAADLLRAALGTAPADLDLDAVLAMGERGFPPAVERLADLAQVSGTERETVLAAAFLAWRGDERGRAALGRARADLGNEVWNVALRMASAGGLRALGDRAAWADEVQRTAARVEDGLRTGNGPLSVWLTGRLAYFHAALLAGRPAPLSDLEARLDAFQAVHRPEFATEAAIRRALDGMRR